MSAGALGCSISGAGPAVFAWAEIQYAESVRGGDGGRIRAPRSRSDSWISALDNAGARVVKDLMSDIEIRKLARPAPRTSRLSEAIRQGLAPDGGLYVPTRLPLDRSRRTSRGLTRLPDIARGALDGILRGRSAASPRSARSRQAALDFPAPTTAVAEERRIRCSCSSCSTDRPRRSRISARGSWPRRCSGCRRLPSRR